MHAGGPQLVIDIETTGFSAASACVIELGAALVAGGRVQRPVGLLVAPEDPSALRTPAARRAQRVHGIAPEEVLRHGVPERAAAARLAAYIARVEAAYGPVTLWAHGASFEGRFLGRAPWGLEGWRCSLALARRALPELRSHRLGALCAHLGVDGGRAHRAPDDAWATAQVLLRLGVGAQGGGSPS